ncbi:hypothetical protein H696_04940 [Fonticula alba]|uniref:Uncharacterized protein n=1 Tax=Fonticula alba TaxID=691883 RepID=A0A058Z2Y2_FONAL|nr:hypothetical protein H696_04940 [Fonticula alba]KCV68649.1 hypothetical protein H696_04940 [Fonticula alba]|eukprot:XP_009497081.1 hypothetical protein H696_04940 [Fonticula alba]
MTRTSTKGGESPSSHATDFDEGTSTSVQKGRSQASRKGTASLSAASTAARAEGIAPDASLPGLTSTDTLRLDESSASVNRPGAARRPGATSESPAAPNSTHGALRISPEGQCLDASGRVVSSLLPDASQFYDPAEAHLTPTERGRLARIRQREAVSHWVNPKSMLQERIERLVTALVVSAAAVVMIVYMWPPGADRVALPQVAGTGDRALVVEVPRSAAAFAKLKRYHNVGGGLACRGDYEYRRSVLRGQAATNSQVACQVRLMGDLTLRRRQQLEPTEKILRQAIITDQTGLIVGRQGCMHSGEVLYAVDRAEPFPMLPEPHAAPVRVCTFDGNTERVYSADTELVPAADAHHRSTDGDTQHQDSWARVTRIRPADPQSDLGDMVEWARVLRLPPTLQLQGAGHLSRASTPRGFVAALPIDVPRARNVCIGGQRLDLEPGVATVVYPGKNHHACSDGPFSSQATDLQGHFMWF